MLGRLAPALSLWILTAALDPAVALADEAGCNADKLGGLSRAATTMLKCLVRTVARADPPDPDCAAEVDARLSDDFLDADAGGGCAATGEVAELTSDLHTFENDVLTLLVAAPETRRCSAAKLRATSRRTKRELVCRRKAAVVDAVVDPLCVADSQASLATTFARRDDSGACATTGDDAAIDALVVGFLSSSWELISAPSDTPSGILVQLDGSSINVSWLPPDPESGSTEVRLLRRLDAAPTGPDDLSATVVFDGDASLSAIDDLTALLPNTTGTPRVYHYAAYGCDVDGCDVDGCETTGVHATFSPTVREALKAGGYVLHWRHASADVCADRTDLGPAATTSVPDWWKSCDPICASATARQLNPTGRAESQAIGDAFATLGILVGRVISSEFCRNVETAQLMDFGPTIEESQDLSFFVYNEANRCNASFAMLAQAPTAGTNTALIGHAGNSCPPLSTLAWAEAAIYKPDGMGGSTYIDRVVDEAWLTLP